MSFEKIFTITCTHQYLADQPCNEVMLQPTPVCQRLMQRYGLLFKKEGAGSISVLHQTAQADKNIRPACTSALQFCLLTTDTAFFSYTKTALQSRDNMLLYSTSGKEEETDFTTTEEAKWKLRLPENYKLFGGLSIVPPVVHRQYAISLSTIATRWQYYIVAEKNRGSYKIDGTVANAPFQQVSDADRLQKDVTYQALQQAYPDAPVLWFESEIALPLSQKARTKIQLVNVDTNMPIIDSLPNPDPTANGITILHL